MDFLYKIDDIDINSKLIRARKKSISLEIDNKGVLIIRAPLTLSDDRVLEFIKSKNDWIKDNILKVRERNKELINRQYIEGEEFSYLGDIYKLCFSDKISIDNENKKIFIRKASAKNDLIYLYKKLAGEYLRERCNYFSQFFDEDIKQILIKEQKTRWGSCTYDNKINFNYKIMLARKEIVDYLVVHEMSHMPHKNHSKDFWNKVYSIIPDAKELRKELKDISHKLEI